MKSFLLFFALIAYAHAYNPLHLEKLKNTHVCQHCDLNELNLSPEVLENPDYQHAVLSGSYFYGSGIENLNLSHANFQEIIGLGLMLHNNELSHADFSYSDLPNFKFTLWNQGEYILFIGSNLDESNFSYSLLNAPQFQGASMSGASLYHIEWPHANLSHTRLRNADLTYAILQYADLSYANLNDALLSHADLSHANLLGATVSDEQLAKAASLCNAIMPDGSVGQCDEPI